MSEQASNQSVQGADLWRILGAQHRELTKISGQTVDIMTDPVQGENWHQRAAWRAGTLLLRNETNARTGRIADNFDQTAFGPVPCQPEENVTPPIFDEKAPYPYSAQRATTGEDFAKFDSPTLGFDLTVKETEKTFSGRPHSQAYRALASGQATAMYGVGVRPFYHQLWATSPIGEYGNDFALNAIRSGHTTMQQPEQRRLDLIKDAVKGHEQTIFTYTTWGRREHYGTRFGMPEDNSHAENAIATTVAEGDASIIQAVGLLTAEYVDGYETGEALWDGIIRDKLVEQLTRKLTFGVIAALSLSGKYIPGLVQISKKSAQLELNPDHTASLDKLHTTIVNEYAQSLVAQDQSSRPPAEIVAENAREQLGLHCPAVMHGGGLEKRHLAIRRQYRTFTGK